MPKRIMFEASNGEWHIIRLPDTFNDGDDFPAPQLDDRVFPSKEAAFEEFKKAGNPKPRQ